MAKNPTHYLGATDKPTAPATHDLPEFAIAGRSNVGKSTLLNALVGERVARTSRTPGRTQLLHFVSYRKSSVLVDLPGLGYANVPRAVQKKIEIMARNTIRKRESLRGLMLLIDIRRKPGDDEAGLLNDALEAGLRVLVVATKADQIPKHRRKPTLEALKSWSGLNRNQTIAASAKEGNGLDAIHKRLSEWVHECRDQPEAEPTP